MPAEDENGARYDGAKLYFYDYDGAPTTTLKAIYTTSALSVQHANPVVCDSVGVWPPIWADTAEEFTVVGTESDGQPLFAYDAVSPSIDATLASVALAESAQTAAELAETNAETAEANAETAETNAETAATAAAASATAAAASAALAEEIAGFTPGNYQLTSAKGQASGYAGLDASSKVPDAHLTEAPISTDQQAALDLKLNASAEATIRADLQALAIAFAVAL